MEPLKLLAARYAAFMDVIRPISEGRVPCRPSPGTLSRVTFPLLQLTPAQPPHGSEIVFQLASAPVLSAYLEDEDEGGREGGQYERAYSSWLGQRR